jgi:3-deoxy-manno-octulosonate cytidylyltransferase (CMP-KDO synthetase)
VKDPARVKVVTDLGGRALYFSAPSFLTAASPTILRRPLLATPRHLRPHQAPLTRWVSLPPTPAELAERLEQLRALQNGMTIGVTRLSASALPGVDTPDDLKRAEAHWHALVR